MPSVNGCGQVSGSGAGSRSSGQQDNRNVWTCRGLSVEKVWRAHPYICPDPPLLTRRPGTAAGAPAASKA